MRVTPNLAQTKREMARTIRRAVVDVQALWDSAAQDRALEDRQKGRDGFAAREGGVGNQAGRIVEQRDQVRLVPPAILGVEHGRPVHHITHPELVRAVVTEAPPVLAGGSVGRAAPSGRGE